MQAPTFLFAAAEDYIMRDFRDAKVMAQTLRHAFSDKHISVSHSECLEIVSRQFGFDNWNILAARIASAAPMRPAEKDDETLYCSFCSRSQHEVTKLVAGSSAFICETCIDLCDTIVLDDDIDVLLGEDRLGGAALRDLIDSRSTENLSDLCVKAERLLSQWNLGLKIAEIAEARREPDTDSAESDFERHLLEILTRKSPSGLMAYIRQTERSKAGIERILAAAFDILAERGRAP